MRSPRTRRRRKVRSETVGLRTERRSEVGRRRKQEKGSGSRHSSHNPGSQEAASKLLKQHPL
jgi:hypothetical protein